LNDSNAFELAVFRELENRGIFRSGQAIVTEAAKFSGPVIFETPAVAIARTLGVIMFA
jgi:hypothetical protein